MNLNLEECQQFKLMGHIFLYREKWQFRGSDLKGNSILRPTLELVESVVSGITEVTPRDVTFYLLRLEADYCDLVIQVTKPGLMLDSSGIVPVTFLLNSLCGLSCQENHSWIARVIQFSETDKTLILFVSNILNKLMIKSKVEFDEAEALKKEAENRSFIKKVGSGEV